MKWEQKNEIHNTMNSWGDPQVSKGLNIELEVDREQIIISLQYSTKIDVILEAMRSNWEDLSRVMALSSLTPGNILWLQCRGKIGRVWDWNWINLIGDYCCIHETEHESLN